MNTQNDNDNGWYGSFSLRGPSSQNIHIGSREWVNSNLPKLNLYGSNDGTNDFHAMELSVELDGEGNEFGFINLHSQNGKSLHLSPEGFGAEGVGMETHSKDSLKYGYLYTRGPNSTNFETGGDWENPDRAYLNMNGDTDENRLRFAIYEDGNQNEHGNIEIRSAANKQAVIEHDQITFWNTGDPNGWKDYVALRYEDDGQGNEQGTLHLNSKEEKTAYLGPRNIALRDDANGYRHLVDMNTNNDSGNGWAGYLNLNGPSTTNISMGTRDWEGTPDLPIINLHGESDFHAMEMTVFKDGNGDQLGAINLMSENGKSLNLGPSGFGIEKATISNIDGNNGTSGELFLHGANSPNIQMGGQYWENSDLGFFTVFTDKSDGNGWYYGGATISTVTDGTNSWGNMGLSNNGEEKILLNGDNGDINIAGVLNQSSDRRLKKDIVKLSSSLDNLSRLQGVSYFWKSDTLNTKPQIGLIAQDVEKVYPELVVTKDDGFKALNYSQMVAVLIEATKELNTKVEKLETENIQLKAELSVSAGNTSEIAELKEQMQALFKMVELQQTEATSEELTSTPGLK